MAASTDPLLRTEAIATLAAWGDADTAVAALGDRVRAVRFAAFEGLVALRAIPGSPTFAAVQRDYVQAALQRGDTPAAWQNILLARAAINDVEGVEHAVREGLERDPTNDALRRFAETLDRK